jgi:glycosyltransferase involved in cell wall biosynthesis
MKVLYDHQIFSNQVFGGVSRYFIEIRKGLDSKISILLSNNFYLRGNSQVYLELTVNFKGKKRLFNFLNELYSIFLLKFTHYDIFHPTYYSVYFLKFVKLKPFILTIHDMTHERFPHYFTENDNTIKHKKLLANLASRVIVVSENTKRDVIEILKIPENKIDVIYHGNSFEKVNLDEEIINKIPEKYILYVGGRCTYKNFINFMHALVDSLLGDNKLYLICAGGGKFTNEELNLFENFNISYQIQHYSATDEELKSLYKNSLFFVFPSFYEGFGIPLLEAMECKTAILCSNSSCFPEIVDNCALTFDPSSIEDIKIKIDFALNNKLEIYIENGTERLKYFSWDKSRKETMNTYIKALNDK